MVTVLNVIQISYLFLSWGLFFFLANVTPFKVRVNFDENEHPPNAIAATIDSSYQDGECLKKCQKEKNYGVGSDNRCIKCGT